jgi:hypothetical protein
VTFNNPEFSRNVRSQLRPGKMATSAAIATALSFVIVFAMNHISVPAAGPNGWGFALLRGLFWLQGLILAAGGGIASVNAIYKEKEQNTFDFQRVTRLSPLELSLGKLFGAPIFMYFLCLCYAPIVIFAAAKGGQQFTTVLAAYVVLFVASVAFHALALLLSLLTVRGSHTSAIIGVLVLLWMGANAATFLAPYLHLGSLSPFYASEIAVQNRWSLASSSFDQPVTYPLVVVDAFFGHSVHHFPVVIVLDTLFLVWFLLALTRNIKRDPSQYELYSPLQSLGIVLFVNVALLGFIRWDSASLVDIQAALLTINGVVLGSLGLAQLRNRDRTRRILRTREQTPPSWVNLAWPAPFLFVAAASAGLLVSAAASFARGALMEWSPAFSVFRSLFFAAWIVRDAQFLQWIVLRRGKRSLLMGVVYLSAFYACVLIALNAFGTFRDIENLPFTAFFLPTAIYYLDHSAWALRPAIWGAAFVAQWIFVALFIYAQRNTILELAHPATPELAPVAAD